MGKCNIEKIKLDKFRIAGGISPILNPVHVSSLYQESVNLSPVGAGEIGQGSSSWHH